MKTETKQALKETAIYSIGIILIAAGLVTLCISLFAPAHTFLNL